MTGNGHDEDEAFVGEVRRQAERARSGRRLSFWEGLSMVGSIGWMVSLPAVLGALGGRWLDRQFASGVLCTMLLLALGLVLGCASAWRYLRKEMSR